MNPDSLSPSDDVVLLLPGNHSDTNHDNLEDIEAARADPQDAEAARANPLENNPARAADIMELCLSVYSGIRWWMLTLVTTGQMCKFYPDIYSNFEVCLILIMFALGVCLMKYLRKYPKKFSVGVLANTVLILKAAVIIPSSIYIRLAIKSLGSPGPFPDYSGVGMFIFRSFIRLLVLGMALLYVWGIYDDIKKIPRVRQLQKEMKAFLANNERPSQPSRTLPRTLKKNSTKVKSKRKNEARTKGKGKIFKRAR